MRAAPRGAALFVSAPHLAGVHSGRRPATSIGLASHVVVRGAAGPYEAAAIAAVIRFVLEREQAARRLPPGLACQPLSAWQRAFLPRHPDDPFAGILSPTSGATG